MATLAENLAKLKQLQDTGQVMEANALLDQMAADAKAAETPPPAEPAAPPPPRSPDVILMDLFDYISHRFGNPGQFRPLVEELRTHLAKPADKPASPAV